MEQQEQAREEMNRSIREEQELAIQQAEEQDRRREEKRRREQEQKEQEEERRAEERRAAELRVPEEPAPGPECYTVRVQTPASTLDRRFLPTHTLLNIIDLVVSNGYPSTRLVYIPTYLHIPYSIS